MSRRRKQLLAGNNRMEKKLTEESCAVLTDIVVYLRGSDISCYEQEKVRRDITQMLIDGEHRGDDAGSVIGEDYQTFCDSVIAEIPKRTLREKSILCGAGHPGGSSGSGCHCGCRVLSG